MKHMAYLVEREQVGEWGIGSFVEKINSHYDLSLILEIMESAKDSGLVLTIEDIQNYLNTGGNLEKYYVFIFDLGVVAQKEKQLIAKEDGEF